MIKVDTVERFIWSNFDKLGYNVSAGLGGLF